MTNKGGRPTKYNKEWKNEREIQDFLVDPKTGALEAILQAPIALIHTEVVLPFNLDTKKGMPRRKNIGRIDIIAIDINENWHIIEVKNPKDKELLLGNAKGIAQLLFYDVLMSQIQGVEPKSLTLVTSKFDDIAKEIVPRNKLPIRIAQISKESVEIITSFTKKDGSTTWKPVR